MDGHTSSTKPATVTTTRQPSRAVLAEVAQGSAEKRTRGCEHPLRLKGSTELVNPTTGEIRTVYASAEEIDGYAQVPCCNRRAEVCEPCSTRYAGDAWQLIHAGLAGGKGIPQAVAGHASTFGTFTAPSFGAEHGVRDKGPCRARRDKPVCRHGRPLWCSKRHLDDDERLGTPLCVDCYDYLGHVLWQSRTGAVATHHDRPATRAGPSLRTVCEDVRPSREGQLLQDRRVPSTWARAPARADPTRRARRTGRRGT